MTLRYSFGRAFAFGRAATFLEKDDPGPTELGRPGYTLFDLGGGFRLSEAIELRCLVRNLADKLLRLARQCRRPRHRQGIVSLALSGRV